MARTADPKDIPERLTAAGLALFLSQGYNATGIQQIASNAGVPKGSFYNHFSSKEAFAAMIIDRYAEQSEVNWQVMMNSAPERALAAIHHVFEQMLEYHKSSERNHGCLVGNFAAEIASSSEQCRQRLTAAHNAWRQRLADLITRGQQEGEIRTDIGAMELSELTWNVWEGALLQMKIEHSIEPLQSNLLLLLGKIYSN